MHIVVKHLDRHSQCQHSCHSVEPISGTVLRHTRLGCSSPQYSRLSHKNFYAGRSVARVKPRRLGSLRGTDGARLLSFETGGGVWMGGGIGWAAVIHLHLLARTKTAFGISLINLQFRPTTAYYSA